MIRRRATWRAEDGRREELETGRRCAGLRVTDTTCLLVRETYFDTASGLLGARGWSLCHGLEVGGEETLTLRRALEVDLQGVVTEQEWRVPLGGHGVYAHLEGDDVLARTLREHCEPWALRPQVALDVDEVSRGIRRRWWGGPSHRLRIRRCIAHSGKHTDAFVEYTVESVGPREPVLDDLAEELSTRLGTVPDARHVVEVVAGFAKRPSRSAEAAALAAPPAVAVLCVHEGRVGLVGEGTALLPFVVPGEGEPVAEEAVRRRSGEVPEGGLEFVGFADPGSNDAALELWLCHVSGAEALPHVDVWMPIMELLGRVGGTGLDDPTLVAALDLLLGSQAGIRLVSASARHAITCTDLPGSVTGGASVERLDSVLSVLDFHQRVLEMALDTEVPLLERARFLSIFSSNLDEFFVVQVGGLKTDVASSAGYGEKDARRRLLLQSISIRVRALVARQYACFEHEFVPGLASHGVRIVRWPDLSATERAPLERSFFDRIFPILTPRSLEISPGHPFPAIAPLEVALGVTLRAPGTEDAAYSLVTLPAELPRFLPVEGGASMIAVEEVVAGMACHLFPNCTVAETHAFRITRAGNVALDEEGVHSLLDAVEDSVVSRPFRPVIRMEVEEGMPGDLRLRLLQGMGSDPGTEGVWLDDADVYRIRGPLDLRGLVELTGLPVPGGVYPSFDPGPVFDGVRPVFSVLDERDVLVHHPFDDFRTSVGHFLREAAEDPDVLSVKLTLYRTGRDSPVIEALLAAAAAGKSVTVFVELKARFDEATNIEWTHRLRDAGVHVVYGLVGLKIHAKTALVVRREGSGVRRYVHIGTGNFNASAARFYTDIAILSSDPELGADVHDFFNQLTGTVGAPAMDYRRLWVSPSSLAPNLVERIGRLSRHAGEGGTARIRAKMNGLTDPELIAALYAASASGVEIDLIVRGLCTLRPGVRGMSERIRVRSILGRFLEHARIFHFQEGDEEEFLVGSADWRSRNLRRRVEVVAPVDAPDARLRLRRILDAELADPRAWVLRSDGVYERMAEGGVTAQSRFMEWVSGGAT